MNEHIINRLAEEAGIVPMALHINPLVVSYHMSHETMDKFVELIVKECASELIKWKDEPFPYDPEFGASLIKQHFGVEENVKLKPRPDPSNLWPFPPKDSEQGG